jgi:transcriptional regulator with PAS, ATPase and Fis domain
MHVDVRVLAATNKDLRELIHQGTFREDLYYRLNVINITIPPLRERAEEVEELASFFAQKYSRKLSKAIKGFTPEALGALGRYAWPGNVRELENVIERAVILSDSETIAGKDLSIPVAHEVGDKSAGGSLEEMERDHILRVLREFHGNQSKTSQILGIDRKTLYLKVKKYGLSDYLKK